LTNKKIKILTLGDMPLLPSGVGTQTKYVIDALLKSEKFQVISLGGAVSHPNHDPIRTEEYGEDWTIYPVDGYGDKNIVRSILHSHRPDMVWFMTDPRFYEWLWEIEDEIRPYAPLVYYHVWDNYPYPTYNEQWYMSTDYIATISKVTSDIVQNVAPEVNEQYIPHAVDSEIFKKLDEDDQLIQEVLDGDHMKDKFVFFWNNRNARRKQSGSLLFWFKKFLDKVGHDKCVLLMHTDTHDPHGQPLPVLCQHLGLTRGQVIFSTQKLHPQKLAAMYNAADCTINISDAEGFGLATLESLSCETPIVVTMTGGLQEQVTDGENWFGVGITPSSKAIIGSQTVPWICEDRINEDEFVEALCKMFYMDEKDRKELGKKGRQHVVANYNFKNFGKTWVDFLLKVNSEAGSWESRKNYNPWECVEL
jgi:glycosyltransferase involved in cell wall biosynthesis